MKAAEWIDRIKTAKGWESDYRIAQELGLTRSAVSKYRSRDSTLDEDTAIRVAQMLGLNPSGIIIDQVAERSKSPELRSSLSKIAGELCILCKAVAAMHFIASCARPTRAIA